MYIVTLQILIRPDLEWKSFMQQREMIAFALPFSVVVSFYVPFSCDLLSNFFASSGHTLPACTVRSSFFSMVAWSMPCCFFLCSQTGPFFDKRVACIGISKTWKTWLAHCIPKLCRSKEHTN